MGFSRSINRPFAYLRFLRDFRAFRRILRRTDPTAPFPTTRDLLPCLDDATDTTHFDPHYIFHTAWASRILAKTRPQRHVDIASNLYFIATISAFVPIDFYDLRPASLNLPNLRSLPGDLLHLPLPDASVPSLSCMHVIEHVGLGRYGDALDPNGDTKAITELKRVLAPGGNLLFVVPTGIARTCFNAHRIYRYRRIIELFAPFTLREFALIPDDAHVRGLLTDPPESLTDAQTYGCGCYWFERPLC